jgi:DNA-binding beta-propeller fold protein YncE
MKERLVARWFGAWLLAVAAAAGCSNGSSGGAGPGGNDASTSSSGGNAEGGSGADATGDGPSGPTTLDVLLVCNSVSGTVSFVDTAALKDLGAVNIIPDLNDRLAEINADPLRAGIYQTILTDETLKHFEPNGGQRFVDDCFVSPDGKTLYASRGNLGDVAAFDLSTDGVPEKWHTPVDGFRADHAALSPDGAKLVVSAITADVADIIDTSTGKVLGSFPTGHFPHQNEFTTDGQRIYNGSIGDVNLPYSQDAQKGTRQITVADVSTLNVLKTYTFTDGVRPTVITADEKTAYLQLSYLNGLVKYDLTTSTIVTTLQEPLSAFEKANYPTLDDLPHNSMHHGLALSGDGTKLCDCGDADDTISIVDVATMTVTSTIDTGLIPYWATTSTDGNTCFVSLSGDDSISVVSYATGQESKRIKVGWFPQRSRRGSIPSSVVPRLSAESTPDGGVAAPEGGVDAAAGG